MTLHEADRILRRLDSIWTMRSPGDSRDEWLTFLLPLEFAPAVAAVDVLRDSSKYRPSMAELKSAYLRQAASIEDHRLDDSRRLLPGEGRETDHRKRYTLLDVYGWSKERWVWCCECCMAISLEEQASTAVYRPGLGLRHASCPKPGTAPLMPPAERNERESYWQRHGIRRGAA